MADNKQQLTASNPALLTLRNGIQKYSPDIQRLIPKHVDGEKIVMIAQAALTKNPDLLNCDPRTVLAGIIQCSIMGLELHTVLHHASLVPFWNSKAGINEAVLMIEYPGLVELVMRGEGVSFVESQPVYANDIIEIEYGSAGHIIHRPTIRGPRGELIGAYSYAKMADGNVKFHYMTDEDIQKRRNVSRAKDSGPWKTWEEEMYAKTPLRHLCKQLRKTAELSIGLEHENRFDQGTTSVVESPNEGGLTLDFLSMNVEAKTIEGKDKLKGQLAERSAGGKGQPEQPPPQPGTSATPPAQATQQPQSPAQGAPAATRGRPRQQPPAQPAAPAQAPTGPPPQQQAPVQGEAFQATDQDLPDNFFDDRPPEEGAPTPEAPPAQPQAPIPQPAPAPTQPQRQAARAASQDPLDQPIDGAASTDLLRLIRDKKLAQDKVRAYLDGLNPRVILLRNLTMRQKNAMVEWINQQQ